jgi:hypothetical protein
MATGSLRANLPGNAGQWFVVMAIDGYGRS